MDERCINIRFRLCRAAVALLCLVLMSAVDGHAAAKHALLIGVGDYPYLPPNKSLEGPAHDVETLAELLRTVQGFPADHIVTLVDEQATRKAVLSAMDRLVDRVGAGDLALIYFSGHGTSSHEYKPWGFDAYTGALLPYDFKMTQNVDEMIGKLIVGRRDIRPILERLDKKSPRVLAIFDACYSGFTIRSSRKPTAKPRYVKLPLKDLMENKEQGGRNEEAAGKPDYPYRNIVYVSAASSEEQAWDITRRSIQSGQPTFDHKPHGALTDAVLRGLSGKADTNGDNGVSWNELFHYAKSTVSRSFSQTPQLLHAEDNTDLLDAPLFRGIRRQNKSAPTEPAATGSGPLRVRLERVPARVKSAVAAVPGMAVVEDGPFDILVTPGAFTKRAVQRMVNIYMANGALLDRVPPRAVAERLSRQTGAQRLIGFSYPDSDFNVFVELMDNKGVLMEDDPVGFVIRSEADAHILLVNIDSTGGINILYPYLEEELAPVRAGTPLRLPELGYVTPPNFGLEYIKVFAFRKQPPGIEAFMGESFTSECPKFEKLMTLIAGGIGGAAQNTLSIKTAARSDMVLAE